MKPPRRSGEMLVQWPSAGRRPEADWASSLRLGLGLDPELPLAVSSHQPVLYHPGIWCRSFLLDRLRDAGWQALWVEADAAWSEVVADTPDERRVLASGVLESLAAPSPQAWPGYVPWLPARAMGEFLARARWQAEGALVQVARAFQSHLCETEAFARFAEEVVRRGDDFRRIYNESLLPERPFRPLEPGELPFWWLSGQARHRHPVPGGRLRPRALLWTLFLRSVADLYLHGTGGAAYDRVTDRVAERFFGWRPAPYAVATLTLRLGDSPPVRELIWNPQRQFPEDPLTARKANLVQQLAALPRGRRAAVTREIHAINRALAGRLDLSRAARLEYRGYSWFCFEPSAVAAAVSRCSLLRCASNPSAP